MDIKVECILCNSKIEFNRFVRNYSDNSYVINHIDISNKLMKVDDTDKKPSDRLIGLHIHNQLKMYNSKLNKFEDHPRAIIYLIKNLNKNTIVGLKHTLEKILEDHNISIDLTVVNRNDFPTKGVLNHFGSVKFIEK
jgi:hypothetical protein